MSDESPKLSADQRTQDELPNSSLQAPSSPRPQAATRGRQASEPGSIMEQVQSQTRRRVRRGRPPAWAIACVQRLQQLRNFLQTRLPQGLKSRRREMLTLLISVLLHVVVGLCFATWLMPESARDDLLTLLSGPADDADDDIRPEELTEIVQPDSLQDLNVDSTMQQMLAELDNGVHRMQLESPEMRDITLPLEDLTDVSDIPFIKGEFGGRSAAGRQARRLHWQPEKQELT